MQELFEMNYTDLPSEVENPSKVSFEEYRKTMSKINDQIYKKIIKRGNGPEIDVERLDIVYDYSMFFELIAAPFDSSIMNKQSAVISVKSGIEPAPGCYLALASMKLGEEAQFVISSELMYGKLGNYCFFFKFVDFHYQVFF